MHYFIFFSYLLFSLVFLVSKKVSKTIFVFIPLYFSTYGFGLVDPNDLNVKNVFQIGDLILLCLIIAYFFYNKKKCNNFQYKQIIKFIYIFIAYLMFSFVVSIFRYSEIDSSFRIFRLFFKYFSLVYFVNIITTFNSKEFERLIELIIFSTLFFGILYILHFGFNIKFFGSNNYIEENYFGTTIYRNFLAVPPFAILVTSYLIIKNKNVYFVSFVLGVLLLDYMLVYTRSWLIIFLFSIFISFVIRLFSNKFNFKDYKKIIIISLLGITTIILFTIYFYNQTAYFLGRFNEVSRINDYSEVANAKLREDIILSRITTVVNTNIIMGLGYIKEDVSSKYYNSLFVRHHDAFGQIIVGDQSWGSFIAANGFLGLFLFLLILFKPLVMQIQHHEVNYLFYACYVSIFYEILLGFFSENFTSDGIFKISFLYSILVFSIINIKSKNE